MNSKPKHASSPEKVSQKGDAKIEAKSKATNAKKSELKSLKEKPEIKAAGKKAVEKKLEKRGIDTDVTAEQKELDKQVRKESAERTSTSGGGAGTSSSQIGKNGASKIENQDRLISLASNIDPEIGKLHKDLKGTYPNEESLKQDLDALEKIQEERHTLGWKIMSGHLLGKEKSDSKNSFNSVVDKYVTEKTDATGRATAQLKTFAEVMGEDPESEKNIFKKFWLILTHPIEYLKYSFAKKYSKQLCLYENIRRLGGKWKDRVEKMVDTAKEVKTDVKKVTGTIRENPAAKEAAQKGIRKYKEAMENLFKRSSSGKIPPERIAAETQDIAQKALQSGTPEEKLEFTKMVKEGSVPGFHLKRVGKFMLVEVASRSILTGFRSPGGFFEKAEKVGGTIADSNIWIEAIPLVGSYKSVKRLFSDNGDPLGVKIFDAGMNIVGDGILIGGMVGGLFTGGASVAGGVALREGIFAGEKSILKKFVTKTAAKEFAAKTVEKVTTKEGLTEVGKGTLQFAKQSGLSIVKWNAAMYAMETAFNKAFPGESKILQVATSQFLTPQQERALEIGMDLKKQAKEESAT